MKHDKELKEKGLYHKYDIRKTNGKEIDENSEYFVLRLDENGHDPKHIAACRKAILTYAEEIKDHLPVLSEELKERYS
jgi:hypothetical protein